MAEQPAVRKALFAAALAVGYAVLGIIPFKIGLPAGQIELLVALRLAAVMFSLGIIVARDGLPAP